MLQKRNIRIALRGDAEASRRPLPHRKRAGLAHLLFGSQTDIGKQHA
jgi:hypothetical protein